MYKKQLNALPYIYNCVNTINKYREDCAGFLYILLHKFSMADKLLNDEL